MLNATEARYLEGDYYLKPEFREALSKIADAADLSAVEYAIRAAVGEARAAVTTFVDEKFGEAPAEAKELLKRLLFAETRRQIGGHIDFIAKGDIVLDPPVALVETLTGIVAHWDQFQENAPAILKVRSVVNWLAGDDAGRPFKPID